MSISDKLNAIAAKGDAVSLAFDGCHKIYLLQSREDISDARACDYYIVPSSQIHKVWEDSCGLRFVSAWSLADDALCIDQGEDCDDEEGLA